MLQGMRKFFIFFTFLCLKAGVTHGQNFLSNLSATKEDPIYATYAAPLERSEFLIDEGYQFIFYKPERGIEFETDNAGIWSMAWRMGSQVRWRLRDMAREPIVRTSYSDLVRFDFQPFPDILVGILFITHSSRIALQDVTITNQADSTRNVTFYPIIYFQGDKAENPYASPQGELLGFNHCEYPDSWTVSHGIPHVVHRTNIWMLSDPADHFGGYNELGSPPSLKGDDQGHRSAHSLDVSNVGVIDFFTDIWDDGDLQDRLPSGDVAVLAFQKDFTLAPGKTAHVRIIRGVQEADADPTPLYQQCCELLTASLDAYILADEALYSCIPHPELDNPELALMYWSAFNLLRQVMMPPEGQCSYNYYLFSREPSWGWGHGGQVLHESLAMLAYAYMDPQSAMDSQRVFMERQDADGYIPYRVGPYLNETIPWGAQLTSSAPWFNWENWEIFQVTRDSTFLKEAYESGKWFYNFWIVNRDSDSDGLCEWGAHAVLECVRDGKVAVWDQVGWPSCFDCLDLNTLLVMEAKSLAQMAQALGDSGEAQMWQQKAQSRSNLINQLMWDPQDRFYYHIDIEDHDFTLRYPDDLKRKEIIGFLPLWAGIASRQQAEALIQHLLNPSEFWRRYGIPTLAADDPYYNPVGYWNGPVWVQWNYLIFRGLLNYDYRELARVLAYKIFDAVITQLKQNHTFWELYSPDFPLGGHHHAYIWTGLVARMVIDLEEIGLGVTASTEKAEGPKSFYLIQNYPNPFNSVTTIQYGLLSLGQVALEIFDLQGRKVRTLFLGKGKIGHHEVVWDGKNEQGRRLPSGLYLCRLQAGPFRTTRKLLLMR